MGLIDLFGGRIGLIQDPPRFPEIQGAIMIPEISSGGKPPMPPEGPTPPPTIGVKTIEIGIMLTQDDPYPFDGYPYDPIPGSGSGTAGGGGNLSGTDPYRSDSIPGILYNPSRRKEHHWIENLFGLVSLPTHHATPLQMDRIKNAYKKILENPCLDNFAHLRACLISLLAKGVRIGVANSSQGDTREELVGNKDFWFVRKHNGVANRDNNSISLAKHLFDPGNENWMTSVLFHELVHLCDDENGDPYHEAEAEILESLCFYGQGDQLSTNDYLEQKGAVQGYDGQGDPAPKRASIIEVDGEYWMIFEDFIVHLNTGTIYRNRGSRLLPIVGQTLFDPDAQGGAPWKWKDKEMREWVKRNVGG